MTQTFKRSRKVIDASGSWSNPLLHDFELENSAHLKVYADDTLLTLGTDYTLDDIGEDAGYEVNIVIPDPGSEPEWWGNDIFILSVEPPVEQGDDISLGGSFGEKFEEALDKLTRRVLSIYDMALRAYKSPLDLDPATLDPDDLVFDPTAFIDFEAKYQTVLTKAQEAAEDADDAANSADDAEQDRQATAADRIAVASDRNTVANDKALVNDDRIAVANDKSDIAGYRDEVEADRGSIEGYRDEVDADRIDVQNDKVIASSAADTAVQALADAEIVLDQALDALADFNDRYLGKFAELPALDNDGSALEGGDLAFATGAGSFDIGMYVWDEVGTEWLPAFAAGGTFLSKSQNLNDLPSKPTARTNLDVYSTAEIDALPGAVAAKTTPVDADSWTIWDSVANAWRRVTGTNLKAYLKTYFDTLYLSTTLARREILTANRTYYVRTDGSDSNNGLADTSGGAFLTIQKAIDTAVGLDLSIYSVTIQLGAGTYTAGATLKSYIGVGPIIIQGDTGTPPNVVIAPSTAVHCFEAANVIGVWQLAGMKLQSTQNGRHGIYADNSRVEFSLLDFGSFSGTGVPRHIYATTNAQVVAIGNYAISGGAGVHWYSAGGASITVAGRTVTLSGTPAFSTLFAFAVVQSQMQVNNNTFSGSATGARYSAQQLSLIHTNGGGTSYLPGNSAYGTPTASGSQYT